MSDEIKVKVHSYGSGRALSLVYFDPISGKKVAKGVRSVAKQMGVELSDPSSAKEAERIAGLWQAALNNDQYQAPSRMTWEDFRQRYEGEKLASLSTGTQETVGGSLDCLERILNPDRLQKLTSPVMSMFQAKLRKEGAKETTIAKHLRAIKAALNWAVKMGFIAKRPAIEMPKRAKGAKLMKGRPITTEEFERMIAAIPAVRKRDIPQWQDYLQGLWLSGLRLGESLALSWDLDAPFSVDPSGQHPRFRILGRPRRAGGMSCCRWFQNLPGSFWRPPFCNGSCGTPASRPP